MRKNITEPPQCKNWEQWRAVLIYFMEKSRVTPGSIQVFGFKKIPRDPFLQNVQLRCSVRFRAVLIPRAPAWYCATTCDYSSNRETSVSQARATSRVLQNPRWPVAAIPDSQRTFSPTQKPLTELRYSRVTKFTVKYWLSFTNSLVQIFS